MDGILREVMRWPKGSEDLQKRMPMIVDIDHISTPKPTHVAFRTLCRIYDRQQQYKPQIAVKGSISSLTGFL